MKLRLPKKLSIALLASITVGFTLSQAEAATKYSTPTYGGAEYIWTNGHWEYPVGTQVNKIARVDNKGGVMVIDNAGEISNSVTVGDTSDYGGVKVMGDTTFTTALGNWAGSIFVEAAAVLNASYNVALKNTEASTAANVYVDGTLNITGRSNLNLNDGNDYQNWYIGETGFINLSAITSVNKGSRDWNIQLGVDEGEPFDLTGYTNRTLGGQLTKKFMSTGADLYGQVSSFAVFCEGVEMDSSKYTINHHASGMSVTYDVATAINKMSLTWAGGEAAWEIKGTNWTDAEGTTTSFANGDDVTFAGSGNKANVGGAVEANAITVTGGAIIDSTADGASLKAGSLSVAAGGDLSIASGKDVNIDTITIAGNGGLTVLGSGTVVNTSDLAGDGMLGIGEGAMVKLTPSEYQLTSTKTIRTSGEGTLSLTTLKINGGTHNITSNIAVTGGDNGEGRTNNSKGIHFNGGNGTLNIMAGTTTVTSAVYSSAYPNQGGTSINVGAGAADARLVTRRIELSDGGSSSLHIGSKGTVVITSENDATGTIESYKTTGLLLSEWMGSTTADIEGRLYAQKVGMYTGDAGMTLNILSGGVVAVKGIATNFADDAHTTASTVTLAKGGKIVLGTTGIQDCHLRTWTITLKGGEIGMSDATTDLQRAMTIAGDVTFNTAQYTWSGTGETLALSEGTGAGTMTVSGNLTGAGSITKIGEGTLVLAGSSNALSNTIQVKAGTLSLIGTYDLSCLDDFSDVQYIGGEGIADGSGFRNSSKLDVVDITVGATLTINNATFIYKGSEVHVDTATGDAMYDGGTNYSALYVNNTGDVSYAAAQKIAGEHEANVTTVILNTTGATITMDAEASVALTMAAAAESATVLATKDITLSSIAGPNAGKSLIFSADGHTVTVQGDNDFTGNVVVDNGTLLAGSANALGGGAIIVSGGNLDLGGHSISNSVNTTGESAIGNGTLQGDLTVDNASLTIDQDLTLAGNLIIQNENRIEVADGATLYLTHTITNENIIELAGRIDISAISGTATGSCYYVGGETKGNGFLQTEYEITLVDCGMSGDLDWSEAEIYHNGNKVTKEDWGYVTYAVTDASKFYIFSGTESVSKVRSLDANTNIQMSSGTTLKVDEDISLTQIQATGAATISIDSGKELSGYTSSMNLTLEGAGVYALDSRTSLGSLALGNDWTGTVRLAGTANNANFNSMVRTGSWLELNGFSGYQNTPTGTTTANIILTDKDDGTAAFTATYGIKSDYDGYTMKFTGAIKGEGTFVANAGNNYVENYEFAGDISGWTGEFRYASGRNTKLTISGNAHDVNAAIDGDGRLTLCVNTSATFNEAVDVNGLTLNNGSATFNETVGVNGLSLNNSSATFNDALQVNGRITASGTSSLAMGEGQTLSLDAAIANSGNLTLSGTFDVSGRANVLIGSDYSGGVTPGNGFGVSTYGVQVVQNSGSATLDWSAAEIVYDTPGFEKRADGYIVQGVNDGMFHVKSGTESVSTAQNAAEEAGITMQGVELNNGTTLIVDKEFSTAQVSLISGSAALNVEAGVTLLSDGADHTGLSLSGNGMYKLAAGSSSPNIDWSGNDWHGTVMLTDAAKQDWNLNDFGHAGSKVGLDGISGNFARPNVCGEIVPTLVLVGDGLTVTACYTNATYTFSGGVEGDGHWTYGLTGNPHKQTYIFTGDVSNWTGAYESIVEGKTSTLQFQGDATKMGAAITQTAGIINVVVGNGTNEHTTTFANTVEASSFTVQEHATAILGGDTTITDSLTLHGLLKTDGGSLTLKDGVSLTLGEGAEMQFGAAMSMKAKQGGAMGVSDNTVIEATSMHSKDGGMGVLNNVNVDIIEDYTIENMSISGSVIDISEGKHLYVKHVNIEADARITDEAAWLDMVDTHGWLDNTNTEASAPVMSLGDTLFYRSGDDAWMRLDHDVSYVALTSELFSNVIMTGSDLWLDLTDLADTIGSARAFSIAFKDALYDVNGLRVVATVDGEHYLDGYYTTKQEGTTTTLYFSSQIPEPTTSTLSLLALAALAARRRRK
ncbi:MAG: hypothetical protein MJ058_08655 [Akkermansia sp.]|nr:hypothetical protein [Akkermansia sp.]